jgi:hypothetical protein
MPINAERESMSVICVFNCHLWPPCQRVGEAVGPQSVGNRLLIVSSPTASQRELAYSELPI